MLPNVPEFAIVYYGVLRAGGVVVPMNPLLKEREVGYYLSDSQARLIIAWSGYAAETRLGAADAGAAVYVVDPAAPEPLDAVDPAGVVGRFASDTAVILYTS